MKNLLKLVVCSALLATGAAQANMGVVFLDADAASDLPEPGTLVLMSLAIGLLAIVRGRRR